MNKDNLLGVTIVIITTIIMMLISNLQVYLDAKSNVFFLFLLIFFLSIVIGVGIPKIFNFKRKNKDEVEFVNDKF